MADYLYRHALQTPDIFQQSGSAQAVHCIQRSLDEIGTLERAPSPLEAHAIATAFLAFLRDLQEPVIVYSLYHTFATATTPKAYAAALQELRPVHYNVFVYVVSMLRSFLRPENATANGMTVEVAAAGFGHLLLQRPPRNTPHFREYTIDEVRSLEVNTMAWMSYYLTTESL